jgi:hypothetical protein
MGKIITLAIGIYIGREIFVLLANQDAAKRRNAIRKKLEQYIKENHPEIEPEVLQRKVAGIMGN